MEAVVQGRPELLKIVAVEGVAQAPLVQTVGVLQISTAATEETVQPLQLVAHL
jgi:hypothetical protein